MPRCFTSTTVFWSSPWKTDAIPEGQHVWGGRCCSFCLHTGHLRWLWIIDKEKNQDNVGNTGSNSYPDGSRFDTLLPNDGVGHAGNRHVFPVWLNLIFPASPSPRYPNTSFPYHSLWQFYFFSPVAQFKNLNASLTPIFISYLHLIVKEIMSIPPKNISRVQTVLTAAAASPLPNPLFHAWIIIITIALMASTASSFIVWRIIRRPFQASKESI